MELELKFALPLSDSQQLQKQLARVPLVGRRKPRRQTLTNTYYDTPEHRLQDLGLALRVRELSEGAQPRWVQTLKIGSGAGSALSQRGEWEEALRAPQLSRSLLDGTPWADLDPQGALFAALSPVFSTRFERLSWELRLGGSSVELALDIGSVQMDGLSSPLCELEIELQSGTPEALFEAAAHISQQLCLLPLHLSKAQRAYSLAQGTLYAPLRARPPQLRADMDSGEMARLVLREAFLQFSANLCSLLGSDAPEVLHQSRVGWRRFKSALKLFKPAHGHSAVPSLQPLQALQRQMATLRDLDVASQEVLPAYGAAFEQGDPARVLQWQQFQAALAEDSQAQRAALHQALADPAVGHCLLQITCWLELGPLEPPCKTAKLLARLQALADELKATQRLAIGDAAAQHRLRILAKRLRYGVESLQSLLPGKRRERWLELATSTQTRIGLQRDRQQAIATAQRLRAAEAIVGFLRGADYAAGLQ